MEIEVVVVSVVKPPIMRTFLLLRWRLHNLHCRIFGGYNHLPLWFLLVRVCFCFKGQSFLGWPDSLQDQQYKILSTSASANHAAALGVDILENDEEEENDSNMKYGQKQKGQWGRTQNINNAGDLQNVNIHLKYILFRLRYKWEFYFENNETNNNFFHPNTNA